AAAAKRGQGEPSAAGCDLALTGAAPWLTLPSYSMRCCAERGGFDALSIVERAVAHQLARDDPVSQFVERPPDDPIHEELNEQFSRLIGVAGVDDCFAEVLSAIRINDDKSNL